MKRIARSSIVAQPAATLYALVLDVEAYPRFLPWCLEAKVHERSAARLVATLTVGVKGLRQSFTTECVSRPCEAIDLSLIEGPFTHFHASWRLVPLNDAATKIEFSLEYEFKTRLLATLLEPLFDHIANTMVDAFTRRAESTGRA
ncbi:MAG: type II toxin-antitoxin system RatA family toxin [Betaproteobacteria bacterium]|nr:type II toxin-antitoxin system RatA family toxin [Betaproteobacteria bacterium]